AQLTDELAAAGWGILSGLAKGIDTVAHRAALQAGAPTLAVLGCGLDRVYPAGNEALAAEIVAAGGALLSEHPFGTELNPGYLIARDRLQSALAAAVVVAQSPIASGTMHTVRFAASQGTPVFCLEPRSHGEQDEGVRVLLDTPADRLWQKLPAWKDARSLGERLGRQPLAKPLAAGGVSRELDVLEELIATRAEVSEASGHERIAPDDARASLFATD
ncbi:MAG TPA: DNA-processing protein DprA, partial [Solirubrobacterales bacterium]|nr:DNA-processing protein DprA [Solirubrobacterales bacterium]